MGLSQVGPDNYNVDMSKISLPVVAWLVVLTATFAASIASSKNKAGPAREPAPAICKESEHGGRKFVACTAELARDEILLFWKDKSGEPYGVLPAILRSLLERKKRLVMAMSAGMFHSDSTPVGLYKEKGKELHAMNTADGVGNFFLKPNGVFYIVRKPKLYAGILETSEYQEKAPRADDAFQAGPLLVWKGVIPDRFKPTDPAAKPRSAIAIGKNDKIHFVYTNQPETFYEFAVTLRDALGASDAIHLDSTSASIYDPALGKESKWLPIGPTIGIVAPFK